MKFHNENLKDMICLFPYLENVIIKNRVMKLGSMDYKNSRFELSDLKTHLEIFSLIKNLKNLVLENIYTTNSEDPETIVYQLKEVLKIIQSRIFQVFQVRIIIESYGYTFAEIFKEKNRDPKIIPGTKMRTRILANDEYSGISSFLSI